jgi:DNA-binding beta-propeller fold protein YncE
LNVSGGVRAIDATSLETIVYVETGSDANWLELAPSGNRLIVSAREPAHTQFRIVANPDAEEFGEVTGQIDRTDNYAGTGNGPGPRDVTIGPDGTYAYVPDLYGSTLTVLDIEAFEVVAQRDVAPVLDGAESANPIWEPSRGTASTSSSRTTREPTAPRVSGT